MGDVVELDSMRPHAVLAGPGRVHVVPVAAIEDYAKGRIDFEDPDVLRCLAADWLALTAE